MFRQSVIRGIERLLTAGESPELVYIYGPQHVGKSWAVSQALARHPRAVAAHIRCKLARSFVDVVTSLATQLLSRAVASRAACACQCAPIHVTIVWDDAHMLPTLTHLCKEPPAILDCIRRLNAMVRARLSARSATVPLVSWAGCSSSQGDVIANVTDTHTSGADDDIKGTCTNTLIERSEPSPAAQLWGVQQWSTMFPALQSAVKRGDLPAVVEAIVRCVLQLQTNRQFFTVAPEHESSSHESSDLDGESETSEDDQMELDETASGSESDRQTGDVSETEGEMNTVNVVNESNVITCPHCRSVGTSGRYPLANVFIRSIFISRAPPARSARVWCWNFDVLLRSSQLLCIPVSAYSPVEVMTLVRDELTQRFAQAWQIQLHEDPNNTEYHSVGDISPAPLWLGFARFVSCVRSAAHHHILLCPTSVLESIVTFVVRTLSSATRDLLVLRRVVLQVVEACSTAALLSLWALYLRTCTRSDASVFAVLRRCIESDAYASHILGDILPGYLSQCKHLVSGDTHMSIAPVCARWLPSVIAEKLASAYLQSAKPRRRPSKNRSWHAQLAAWLQKNSASDDRNVGTEDIGEDDADDGKVIELPGWISCVGNVMECVMIVSVADTVCTEIGVEVTVPVLDDNIQHANEVQCHYSPVRAHNLTPEPMLPAWLEALRTHMLARAGRSPPVADKVAFLHSCHITVSGVHNHTSQSESISVTCGTEVGLWARVVRCVWGAQSHTEMDTGREKNSTRHTSNVTSQSRAGTMSSTDSSDERKDITSSPDSQEDVRGLCVSVDRVEGAWYRRSAHRLLPVNDLLAAALPGHDSGLPPHARALLSLPVPHRAVLVAGFVCAHTDRHDDVWRFGLHQQDIVEGEGNFAGRKRRRRRRRGIGRTNAARFSALFAGNSALAGSANAMKTTVGSGAEKKRRVDDSRPSDGPASGSGASARVSHNRALLDRLALSRLLYPPHAFTPDRLLAVYVALVSSHRALFVQCVTDLRTRSNLPHRQEQAHTVSWGGVSLSHRSSAYQQQQNAMDHRFVGSNASMTLQPSHAQSPSRAPKMQSRARLSLFRTRVRWQVQRCVSGLVQLGVVAGVSGGKARIRDKLRTVNLHKPRVSKPCKPTDDPLDKHGGAAVPMQQAEVLKALQDGKVGSSSHRAGQSISVDWGPPVGHAWCGLTGGTHGEVCGRQRAVVSSDVTWEHESLRQQAVRVHIHDPAQHTFLTCLLDHETAVLLASSIRVDLSEYDL